MFLEVLRLTHHSPIGPAVVEEIEMDTTALVRIQVAEVHLPVQA